MKKIILTSAFLIASTSGLNAADMNIYAQVSANIQYVKSEGSSVNKGDVLVRLDSTQAKAKLNEVSASSKYKKVIYDDAKKVLDDYSLLYDSTVASRRELDLAKLNEQKARYAYEEQESKVAYYTEELKKYIIRAPFNGTITKLVNQRNVTNIKSPKSLMEFSSK